MKPALSVKDVQMYQQEYGKWVGQTLYSSPWGKMLNTIKTKTTHFYYCRAVLTKCRVYCVSHPVNFTDLHKVKPVVTNGKIASLRKVIIVRSDWTVPTCTMMHCSLASEAKPGGPIRIHIQNMHAPKAKPAWNKKASTHNHCPHCQQQLITASLSPFLPFTVKAKLTFTQHLCLMATQQYGLVGKNTHLMVICTIEPADIVCLFHFVCSILGKNYTSLNCTFSQMHGL